MHPDKHALIDAVLKNLRKQLEARLPDDNATLDQIEDAVADIGSTFEKELQQRIADQRSHNLATIRALVPVAAGPAPAPCTPARCTPGRGALVASPLVLL